MANEDGELHIYLDTSALIEFRSLTELNWLDLVGEESATLVIAHAVLQELQRVKDGGTGGNLPRRKRERAGAILKALDRMLFPVPGNTPAPFQVRQGIQLVYDRAPPMDETFNRHGLDPRQGDGRLVATVAAARDRGQRVCLIANDYGARWLAKGLQLAAFDLMDAWRVPDEPDQFELENRELKKQLAAELSRSPKLSLSFGDGQSFVSYDIPRRRDVVQQTQAHLEALQLQYDAETNSAFRMARSAFVGISSGEKEQYTNNVKTFMAEAERLIPQIVERRNLLDLHVEVSQLQLSNGGTAPGETIEIVVRAPAGVTIVVELPEELRLPPRPTPPRDLQALHLGMLTASRVFPHSQLFMDKPASPFELECNGDRLRISAGTVRHGKTKVVPKFYFVFSTYETVHSFSFDYELHAHNLPAKTTGRLNVKLERGERMSELRLERETKEQVDK